jgi:Rapamycin-insensitive companion of mTOR RasGEF_N domain
MGPVESGRIYATHHLRVLLRSAVMENNSAGFAKWGIPLLLNQLKDNCRTVVMTAADILDEATDDSVRLFRELSVKIVINCFTLYFQSCIEVLIPLQSQFNQLIQQQEQQHLGLRGRLLLIKTISTPSGFKLWNQEICTESGNDQDTSSTSTFIQKELINWVEHFNVRYVQMVESDLADGLTHHQRADDGKVS